MEKTVIDFSPFGKDAAAAHLFSDSYTYYGHYKTDTTIRLTQYNEDMIVNSTLPGDVVSFRNLIREDCVNWFHVTGLADSETITRLLTDFDCLVVDVKAVMTPCHAAKIDWYKDRLLIVMESCYFTKAHTITSEHICILAKGNVVISFKEKNDVKYDSILYAIRKNTMHIRSYKSGMLVAFLMNAIISVTIGSAMLVEEMLEEIDDILLNPNHNRLDVGKRIQECRHVNLIIQKNTIPLRTEFNRVMNSEMARKYEDLIPIFREVYNELDFIVLTSQNCKELLSSMRDLYMASNDLKTNGIMKRLTIVSTLFIPITFLVGLWGMNFAVMPEVNWKYGYIFAWVVLLVTGFATWRYMKRNKWF
ncbi:MAG: magnesium and cobalt transport protein CorA [Tannerellaceae bacterium]|nr:magnesium and cobalt transport protein CorA [Tannerellaceae bacterium]